MIDFVSSLDITLSVITDSSSEKLDGLKSMKCTGGKQPSDVLCTDSFGASSSAHSVAAFNSSSHLSDSVRVAGTWLPIKWASDYPLLSRFSELWTNTQVRCSHGKLMTVSTAYVGQVAILINLRKLFTGRVSRQVEHSIPAFVSTVVAAIRPLNWRNSYFPSATQRLLCLQRRYLQLLDDYRS